MKLSVPVLGTAYYLMSMADFGPKVNGALEIYVQNNLNEGSCRNECDIRQNCNQYVWKLWIDSGIRGRCWLSQSLLTNIVSGSSDTYSTPMTVISGQKQSALPPTPLGPYESCTSLNAQSNTDSCFTSYTNLLAGLQTISIPYWIALVVHYDVGNAPARTMQPQCQTESCCRLTCTYNLYCFQYVFQQDKSSGIKTCFTLPLPWIVGVTLYSNPVPSTVSIVVGEKAWCLPSGPVISKTASQKNVKGRTRKNVKARTFSPATNQYYALCISKGLSQSAGTETADSTCAAAYKSLIQTKLCAKRSPLLPCDM